VLEGVDADSILVLYSILRAKNQLKRSCCCYRVIELDQTVTGSIHEVVGELEVVKRTQTAIDE